MDAYGWLTLGMVVGIGIATLFITTLEAMQRQWHWIEALIEWIEKRLPSTEEES